MHNKKSYHIRRFRSRRKVTQIFFPWAFLSYSKLFKASLTDCDWVERTRYLYADMITNKVYLVCSYDIYMGVIVMCSIIKSPYLIIFSVRRKSSATFMVIFVNRQMTTLDFIWYLSSCTYTSTCPWSSTYIRCGCIRIQKVIGARRFISEWGACFGH